MKRIKDMKTYELFYFSIFLTLFEIYGIAVTFRRGINGLEINNFGFLAIEFGVIVISFFVFFFVHKNIYWKIGYILYISAGLLHALARLTANISTSVLISLHIISLFLSISAIFCFFKFKIFEKEVDPGNSRVIE